MFTIFGGSGLIGTALRARLSSEGEKVFAPARSHDDFDRNLGHVIYCIGDDRYAENPFAVVETHVSVLSSVLERCDFESFLYLSTTRVYMGGADTSEEAEVSVDPLELSYLYNLTKLTGEALCLAMKNERVRIARLSNVTGVNPRSHYFLPAITRRAIEKGEIDLYLAPNSAKDYILLDDVVDLIVKIARGGARRIYNVASGINIPAGQVVEALQRSTGCKVRWHEGSPEVVLTPINIARIMGEFRFRARSVMDELPNIIAGTRQALLSQRVGA